MPKANFAISAEVVQQVEVEIKYAGYVKRQEIEVARFKDLEDKLIPSSFDYATVPSLRLEARQKLSKIRPRTIGQAGRISGVSPADLSILLVWLKRQNGSSSTCESSSNEIGACEALEPLPESPVD
jgi:tRNA uridine 5-carboxymethylaminomethyl modification enzyme